MIHDDSCGTYTSKNQIKFKTSMLISSLCGYSDAYILVSGNITVAALAAGGGNNDIQVAFKNCAPFTDYISKINNAKIDIARDINVVMPMYNLIEYSNNYSKKNQEVYGNTIKMNQLKLIVALLIIFLVIGLRLNKNKI